MSDGIAARVTNRKSPFSDCLHIRYTINQLPDSSDALLPLPRIGRVQLPAATMGIANAAVFAEEMDAGAIG